jgi:hypothetical protein
MWREGSLAGESALCQCCAVTVMVRLAQCDACCLCQGPAASVRMLTAATLTWSDTAAAHEVSSSAAAPISAERASMAGRNTAVPLLGLQCRPLDWCASSPFAGHNTRQFVSPMWREGSLAGESALCQCCAVTVMVRLAQCDACCLCQGPAASVRMLTATTLTWSDTAAAHEVSSSAAAPISAERASMAGRNTAVPLLGLQCRPLDWCASSSFAGHSTRQFVSPMWREGSLAGESALSQCCAVTVMVRLAQCDACCLCQGPAASVRMMTAATLTWSDTAAAHEASSSAAAPISAKRASMAGRNTAVPVTR